MRLDLYLTQTFNIQSRNKALELIKSDKVKIIVTLKEGNKIDEFLKG